MQSIKPRQLCDKSSVRLDKTLEIQFLGNVKMIYLSLITILTLCGVQSMKNGRRADDTEFSFVVSIQHQLLHLCSGTIIDKYHVLTVAHVVAPHSASALLVVPGMSEVQWPYSVTYTVKYIYSHPHYRESILLSSGQVDLYWENDIAILRLTMPLRLNLVTGLVPLSTTNFESYRCFECTMISWNYPDESNLEMVVLMWDIVNIVENHRCEQFGIKVLANQQCFIDFLETAFISSEDLGSPIICGNTIVGLIVKEARQGVVTSPATFLYTLNYTEFISEIINDGEMDVQPGEFPYIVSIWHSNKHVCGGVIVNSNQVITAVQCIRSTDRLYSEEVFKVAVGSNEVSQLDSSVQWYVVRRLQAHPYYRRSYKNDSSWWTEQDIGFITVSTPFLWNPTVQKISFVDVDDTSTNQFCQVLHWREKQITYRRKYRKLTKTSAVLVDDGQSLVPLRMFEMAAKELYSVNRPEITDIGNPIICGSHPLGIIVRIDSTYVESQTPKIIFLRIRPYFPEGFFVAE